MELHILLAGVEFGPYSDHKARELLDEGFLSASDPAKRLDQSDWLPLSDVLEGVAAGGASGSPFEAPSAALDEPSSEAEAAPSPEPSEEAIQEPTAATEEIHEPEPETVPMVSAEESIEPVEDGTAPSRRADLTVSRPTLPIFRATMPIPTRPATASLPLPRLTAESKTGTQSLPKPKSRRSLEADAVRPAASQFPPIPATPEIKSSFAAALAKTRSLSGDTAPLPAPPRLSGLLATAKPAEPESPSTPALVPPSTPRGGARLTSPIRATSMSTLVTSPLLPVSHASRAKKPTVTGSLLAKEALLKARDRTGVLGARSTSSLAPAADFEPEPTALPKRIQVLNSASAPEAPATQRKAIRLSGSLPLAGSTGKLESAPSLARSALAPPAQFAPPISATRIVESDLAPSVRATTHPSEDALAKPNTQRKAIRLTGPISLPGHATQPTSRASDTPPSTDTAPLTGRLLNRNNRRGVTLPGAPARKTLDLRLAAEEPLPVAGTGDTGTLPVQDNPPLRPPFTGSVPAKVYLAAPAAEASDRSGTDLSSSGQLSSGTLKISGALKHTPPPRTPIRLSSPSGESQLGSAMEETLEKPAPPVPEEQLTSRAPTGKIPLHEFPTEGVRVRSTRRLTTRVAISDTPNEAITSESPQRVPPPLPKKIELPGMPFVEPLSAPAFATSASTPAPALPGPADVFVERPAPTEMNRSENALPPAPAAEPEADLAPPAGSEPATPEAPREIVKPDKVRLRRPVKLELASRKINDSGRLTLEAFSKMASLPAAPPQAETPVPSEAADQATDEFAARKLEEVPPLSWPRGVRRKAGLEWIFYAIITVGLIATAVIAWIVLRHNASDEAKPSTAAVVPPPTATAPPPDDTAPPPSAAPPGNTSAPAVVSTSAAPPSSAAPPAIAPPTATPPSTPAPTPVASTNAATESAPAGAATAPIMISNSVAQDAARQASAFVSDGILKYQAGDFDAAISAYNEALNIYPKSPEAFFNRGIAKAAHDDLDGAVADYSQALQVDPNMGPAYYYRGLARHSKAELDGAISDYNDAVRINPKNALAFFNRGLIRMQKDDVDGAIVDSTRALELDPHLIQSYYDRGLGRLAKGAADGALADMMTFTKLAPQDAYTDYARLYTWLIQTQKGQLAEANKELREAMNKGWNGKPTDMVTRIGEFLLGQISEDDLIKSSASAIPLRDQGQRCEAWYFIGMRKLEANDREGAAEALRKCVDTQKIDYCEYILAQEALKRIGAPVDSTPPPGPRTTSASLPDPGTMAPAPH